MRSLTDSELFALRWFAERVGEFQRDSLLGDLEQASARETRAQHLLLEFDLAGYTRPEPAARRAIPIDAAVLDADGAQLNVALSTDENGRLLDLEVLRFDEKPVAGPDWLRCASGDQARCFDGTKPARPCALNRGLHVLLCVGSGHGGWVEPTE